MAEFTSRPSSAQTAHLSDPMRFPESASNTERTKRAFILILLSFFMPGSAQIAAGQRRFGRKALVITFASWLLALLVIFLALFHRETLINVLTGRFVLIWVLLLIALAIFWLVMMLSTLKLLRIKLLAPGLRVVTTVVVLVLAAGPAVAMAYGAYVLNITRGTISSIFASGPSFAPVDGRYNFLLMGGDAGEDRSGRRPDSIVVFSVDAKTGQATTISIPRNLQNAPFPDGSPLKSVYPDGYNCGDDCIINSLYTNVTNNYKDLYPKAKDPGAAAMMDAASGVLGIKIQAYVIVDMSGFQQLVDALGGITIKNGGWVPIEYYDIPGSDPSNPQKYPPKEWIEPGEQHLNGNQALWYARSRYLSTDYQRIRRQQCVQQAMIKQLNPQTVLTRFQDIASAGTQVIETDIPQDQLGSFMSLALKARSQPVNRLTIGPPDMGDNLFTTYPDFTMIHQRVQDLLHPAPKKASAQAQQPSDPQNDGASAPDVGAQGDGSTGSGDGSTGDNGNNSGDSGDNGAASGDQAGVDPTKVSEAEVRQLADSGDLTTLEAIVSANGDCSPG